MYLPEAFQKKMKAILGEEYDDFLAGFEKPRHYGLRVNTAKITVEEFKELVPFHLTQIPWAFLSDVSHRKYRKYLRLLRKHGIKDSIT